VQPDEGDISFLRKVAKYLRNYALLKSQDHYVNFNFPEEIFTRRKQIKMLNRKTYKLQT
jgi:hypothetical protein